MRAHPVKTAMVFIFMFFVFRLELIFYFWLYVGVREIYEKFVEV